MGSANDSLAFDEKGEGVPVVFLHGLTFDRTTWRPIVDRLGAGTRSIAIDLPGHGESAGSPCPLEEVASQVNDLLTELRVDRPVVVGHSMSGGLAMIFSATHPVRGVVVIDQSPLILPFAQLLRRLEPALRADFDTAFQGFQQSMGLDRVGEPLRSSVLETQRIDRDLVLGYWQEVLQSDPAELQARVDQVSARIEAPCLAVFGHRLPQPDRDYMLAHVPGVQIEEWPEGGHLVHLAEPDRFAGRLREFVEHCAPLA